jgi:plasmid stabilization system protein ParE
MSMIKMSRRAEKWFLEKIEEISAEEPGAAEKIVAHVERVRQMLADFPKAAKPGDIPGTSHFVVEGFILTLKEVDGALQIVGMRADRQSDAYAPSETDDPEDDSSNIPSGQCW